MRSRFGLLVASVVFAGATALFAVEVPVAVSPGDASQVAVVESRCTTFSWGEVEGARGYDLVVYRVGGESEEAQEVLRRSFAGSVYGWTPGLDSCLERGHRYAWSVRAIGGQGASEWSAPRLFEVAAGPSRTELEAALQVVRQVAEERGSVESGQSEQRVIEPSRAGPLEEATSGPTTRSHAGTGSTIIVDGAVAETKADPPCYDALVYSRLVDCGNGTVLDSVTGLLWLANANCLFSFDPPDSGRRDWWAATAFAQGLSDGTCGLSDHSQPGDWRLPSDAEWASVHDDSCAAPELVGRAADGIAGCFTDTSDAWATGVVSSSNSFYWSSTTRSPTPSYAYGVSLGSATAVYKYKSEEHYFWPVRSSQ